MIVRNFRTIIIMIMISDGDNNYLGHHYFYDIYIVMDTNVCNVNDIAIFVIVIVVASTSSFLL